MQGNNFNLVEAIQGYLTGDVMGKMSSVLGESGEKTRTGISAAIPGLLAALGKTTTTPDGARKMTSAVNDADEGILDNLTGMLGKGFSSDTGTGILRSILGVTGLSALTGSLGRASGLSGTTATTLIGMLAPVVFSVLKRVMRGAGPAGFDIASLFSSQRNNIAAAMPEGMLEEPTYAGPRAAPGAGKTIGAYREARTSHTSRFGWIVPLALLAGALGLVWYWAGRPREGAFTPPATVHAGREDATKARTVPSLADLRAKYQSVFRVAEEQGVRISEVREQGGKLMLKGTAPSMEAANNVWGEIKRVNPSLNDIVADFTAPLSAIPLTPDATAPDPAMPDTYRSKPVEEAPADTGIEAQTYTVRRGDTLRSISNDFYGNTADYTSIFEANRDQLTDPDRIEVGQELKIPAR